MTHGPLHGQLGGRLVELLSKLAWGKNELGLHGEVQAWWAGVTKTALGAHMGSAGSQFCPLCPWCRSARAADAVPAPSSCAQPWP